MMNKPYKYISVNDKFQSASTNQLILEHSHNSTLSEINNPHRIRYQQLPEIIHQCCDDPVIITFSISRQIIEPSSFI